jgi:hypothetical protein
VGLGAGQTFWATAAALPADTSAAKLWLYAYGGEYSTGDGVTSACPAWDLYAYQGSTNPYPLTDADWDWGTLAATIAAPESKSAEGEWGSALTITAGSVNYFRLAIEGIADIPQFLVDSGYWYEWPDGPSSGHGYMTKWISSFRIVARLYTPDA